MVGYYDSPLPRTGLITYTCPKGVVAFNTHFVFIVTPVLWQCNFNGISGCILGPLDTGENYCIKREAVETRSSYIR